MQIYLVCSAPPYDPEPLSVWRSKDLAIEVAKAETAEWGGCTGVLMMELDGPRLPDGTTEAADDWVWPPDLEEA